MCAISGFLAKPKHQEEAKSNLINLLTEGQIRGNNATGFAWHDKGEVNAFKSAKPASQFIELKSFQKTLDSYKMHAVIAHNRAETQGTSERNVNNHPIINKDNSLAIVHNGVIMNDHALFRQYDLERKGQVDSEIIVALIEHFCQQPKMSIELAIQKAAKEIRGGLTFALMEASHPDRVWLVCSNNPLHLVLDTVTGTIYWASTEDMLKDSLSDELSLNYFPKSRGRFVIQEAEDDSLIRVQLSGLETWKIERPSFVLQKSQDWADEGQQQLPEVTGEKETPKSSHPLIPSDAHDQGVEIKKPSRYTSGCLLSRLWELSWTVKDNDPTYQTLLYVKEWQRLLSTMEARKVRMIKLPISPYLITNKQGKWLVKTSIKYEKKDKPSELN